MEDRKVLADKYQIISEIKKGGFGTVYFGYDLHMGKPVAIKEINPSLLNEAQYIDMFQTEARNVAQLNHRNIVHIYDFQRTDDNKVFIIMEYIDGGDLRKAFRKCQETKQRIPLNLAAYIIGEVCKALDFAFTRKNPETNQPLRLVHQDICPSNIMLSSQGVVKLIDFGIAGIRFQQMSEKKNSVIVAGKLPYMSPEQLDSDFRPTRNSDVFALGAVFYEILTGQRAFGQTQADELVESIRRAKIDTEALREADVPVEVQKIILQSMQKEPQQRYRSAREMRLDIDEFLARIDGKQDLSEELANWVQNLFSQSNVVSEDKRKTDESPVTTVSTATEEDLLSDIEMDSFYEPQLEGDGEKPGTSIPLQAEQSSDIETTDVDEDKSIDTLPEIDFEAQEIIPYEPDSIVPTKLETEEEEAEDELKTIIDVVRLSARTHKKAIIGSLVGILAAFLLFSSIDTVFRWTAWGEGIYDFIFPPAIKIVTIPPDAKVFLDDKDLNITSPVSIPRISPGVHKLTLSMPGYPDVIRSIQVPSKGAVTVVGEKSHSTREPYLFRFQTSIEVQSNPPGATVYLNDIQYSEVTPCTVPWDVGVPLSIKMEKGGFELLTGFSLDLLDELEQIEDRRIWYFRKATDEYKHYSIEGTFRKHILVNSIPIGAEIFVDDESNPIGLTGYQSDVLLAIGRHDLILRREGYIPRRVTVYVDENGPSEINEVLYRTVRFFAKDVTDPSDNEIGATVTQLISKGQITRRNDITPCEIAMAPYRYEALVQKNGYRDALIQIAPNSRVVIARMEPEAVKVVIKVLDALTGAPINKAQVSFRSMQDETSNEKYFAMTDTGGQCMREIAPGRYTFKVKKFGYSQSVKTFIGGGNGNNTLSFRLVLM